MAVIAEIDQKEWDAWVATRPECVQELCRKLPPNRLYRLQPGGRRVVIYSYSEDGTVMVTVSGKYNFVAFERQVFGIKPEDLEECELPAEGELLGVALTAPDDIEAFSEMVREATKRDASS